MKAWYGGGPPVMAPASPVLAILVRPQDQACSVRYGCAKPNARSMSGRGGRESDRRRNRQDSHRHLAGMSVQSARIFGGDRQSGLPFPPRVPGSAGLATSRILRRSGTSPWLIRRRTDVQVAIGVDRAAVARELARAAGADIVICDDGLQHYRLHRGLRDLRHRCVNGASETADCCRLVRYGNHPVGSMR